MTKHTAANETKAVFIFMHRRASCFYGILGQCPSFSIVIITDNRKNKQRDDHKSAAGCYKKGNKKFPLFVFWAFDC